MRKEEVLVYLKVLSQHLPGIIAGFKPRFRNRGPVKYETSSLNTRLKCSVIGNEIWYEISNDNGVREGKFLALRKSNYKG